MNPAIGLPTPPPPCIPTPPPCLFGLDLLFILMIGALRLWSASATGVIDGMKPLRATATVVTIPRPRLTALRNRNAKILAMPRGR